MDNGDNFEGKMAEMIGSARKLTVGVIREVAGCQHLTINPLLSDARVPNFFVRGPAYVVIEDKMVKVVCPACLLLASTTDA